jgi:inhibitor of KinA sporulation pathway (predicted exonuclease)
MRHHIFDPTPIAIYDLEATCWGEGDPLRDRQREESEIIEIGAVMLRFHPFAQRYFPAEEFTTFVRPKLHPHLSDFCTELTSITQSDVEEAPLFGDAVALFARWLFEMDLVAVHPAVNAYRGSMFRLASWGRYDYTMLMRHMELNNVFSSCLGGAHYLNLKEAYIDHMKLLKRPLYGGRGLSAALKANNIEVTGRVHRGVDDARNTAHLMASFWCKDNLTGHQSERKNMNLIPTHK